MPRPRRDLQALAGLKIRRHFGMTLDPALAKQVQTWMESESLPLDSEPESVRQLLRISFASTPELGYLAYIRNRAYNEVREWAYRSLGLKFREMAEETRSVLQLIEAENAIHTR